MTRGILMGQKYRLATHITGTSGPTVVFLHGLLGNRHYWDAVVAELAPRRCVTVDLLGFGDSPKPNLAYTTEEHLAPLIGLCREVGADSVVGHSVGAILALSLAAWPETGISRVGAIGLPVFTNRHEAAESLSRQSRFNWLFMHSRFLSWATCMAMCASRPLLKAVAPRLRPDLPAAVVRGSFDHTWPSYSRTLERVLLERRIWPNLDGVDAQLLHGAEDTTAPPANVVELSKTRGWELRVVPAAGHGLVLEQPGAVADWVNERLS